MSSKNDPYGLGSLRSNKFDGNQGATHLSLDSIRGYQSKILEDDEFGERDEKGY